MPIPFDVRKARRDWADRNRRTRRVFRLECGFYGRLLREDATFPGIEVRWVATLTPGTTVVAALAASARTGFSVDACVIDGVSPAGMAHRSAMRSSASRRGTSNISSTEWFERSTPSKRSASFCVSRINTSHNKLRRSIVCTGRLHGMQCYLYFQKGRGRRHLIYPRDSRGKRT